MLDVLKNRATYSQVLYKDVMTGRGGQNREKCAGCSEEQSNILTGIIVEVMTGRGGQNREKNLDVLKNRTSNLFTGTV